MKYFSALADAEFARAAFTAAGLDFEAFKTAKNTDCLKTAIAAVKPSADAETILAQAAKENEELTSKVGELSGKLTAAETNAAQFATLTASLNAAGVKLGTDTDATKVKAAIDLHSATAARNMVARAGHPGLLDDPALDPTKQETVEQKANKAKTEGLTGRDRMAAAFNSEIASRDANKRRRN